MKTDIVIYSKDRPCQLDLLLKSIDLKFKNKNNVFVLYDWSDLEYKKSYDLISKKEYDFNLNFIPQTRETFYNVLKTTVEKINTEFICPLCDDDVFIRETDISNISKHVNDNIIGIHLRFSKDLTISYHTGRIYDHPNWEEIEKPYIKWNWTSYPIIDRWGYPYQAGGLIYKTDFFLHMICNSSFYLPNSLETAMMEKRHQWSKSEILGFEKSPIVNVSINRVQNDVNNRGGRDINYSPKQLNDIFLSGKTIDYSKLNNYENNCEFIEIPLEFI
jgi:hypothetical protein